MVSTLDAQMPASREQQQQKKTTFPKIHIFCHIGEIFMNPLVWDKCYTLSSSVTMEDADSIKKERNSIWGNWASLVAQLVKNLPAVEETRVQSLGWEDPLEKEMATHSSILAWKISWTEEPGGRQPMESQRVGHD